MQFGATISELTTQQIIILKDLWDELNHFHVPLASNFAERFVHPNTDAHFALLNSRADAGAFIATVEKQIIGFCIVTKDGIKGEIDSIYVREAYRQGGIGSELLRSSLKWFAARQCSEIIVEIAEGNEGSSSFYNKHNFKLRFYTFQLHQIKSPT